MEKPKAKALQVLRVDSHANSINRAHLLFHSLLLSLFLYYRLRDVFVVGSSPHLLLLLLAELLYSFLWLNEQASRWRLVDRSVFIDHLPDETRLPSLDVLICTADPDKEPTVEVMSTVVSAMALDYPGDKVNVYLSDDGGAEVTLRAMKEAWVFATWWIPFCRRYMVKCRCPTAYFGDDHNQEEEDSSEAFIQDKTIVKEKYEVFKRRIVETTTLVHRQKGGTHTKNKSDHPPLVKVINDSCTTEPSKINPDHMNIPLLVYVAREKRPSHPHHFKAGALNVLLRVSGLLSNSPVVLVLDCDMYCNDPTTAKQAMCFFLDKNVSPTLGFVQFPQRFHNLSKRDIYDMDFRNVFKVVFRGMGGVGTGPIMCGTGFYVNRRALYSHYVKGMDPVELRDTFGPSNHFINTLTPDVMPKETKTREISDDDILHEAESSAACSYEKETKWGDGVGFYYYSVVEDIFTGYHLHIRGWKSVYLDPQRASFLGSSTTNLNDMLIQNTRWSAGLSQIGLSRFCPFTYGPATRHLSLLHRCGYAYFYLWSIYFIPVWCFAVIPQLCLIRGIPIYSKISTSMFPLVTIFVFLSALLKHLHEVLSIGGTTAAWWNEQSGWIVRTLTSSAYGSVDAVMKISGLKETSFIPTNKVVDEEQVKMYQQGVYDFQTSNMFLVPLGTVVILNLVCFVVGSVRMVLAGNWDEMAVQAVLSGFFVVMSLPVIEGMVVRKDKGRFPASTSFKCVGACFMLLLLGPSILVH